MISEENPSEEEVQEAENLVSAAIMAAVLEERQKEQKHCPTCSCDSKKAMRDGLAEIRDPGRGDNNNRYLGSSDSQGGSSQKESSYRMSNGQTRSTNPPPSSDASDPYQVEDGSDELVASLLSLRLKCESLQQIQPQEIDKREEEVKDLIQLVDCDEKSENNYSVSKCVCGRPFSTGTNVIDVGTQTVPSYIGESGKVRSTCIYCKGLKSKRREVGGPFRDGSFCSSLKGSDGESISSEVSCYATDSNKKSGVSPDRVSSSCSWEWPPEASVPIQSLLSGGDSGSPSTPSSFTSVSCDSELSCVASPQLSPSKGAGLPPVPTPNSCRSVSPKGKNFSLSCQYLNDETKSSSIVVDTIPRIAGFRHGSSGGSKGVEDQVTATHLPADTIKATPPSKPLRRERRSPENSRRSPENSRRSPENSKRSPENSKRSPENSRRSFENSRPNLGGKTDVGKRLNSSCSGRPVGGPNVVPCYRKSLVSEMDETNCLEVSADLLARLTATVAMAAAEEANIFDDRRTDPNMPSIKDNLNNISSKFCTASSDLFGSPLSIPSPHKSFHPYGSCGEQSRLVSENPSAVSSSRCGNGEAAPGRWAHPGGVVASTATASATVTLL